MIGKSKKIALSRNPLAPLCILLLGMIGAPNVKADDMRGPNWDTVFSGPNGETLRARYLDRFIEIQNYEDNGIWSEPISIKINDKDGKGEKFRNIESVKCDDHKNDLCIFKIDIIEGDYEHVPIDMRLYEVDAERVRTFSDVWDFEFVNQSKILYIENIFSDELNVLSQFRLCNADLKNEEKFCTPYIRGGGIEIHLKRPDDNVAIVGYANTEGERKALRLNLKDMTNVEIEAHGARLLGWQYEAVFAEFTGDVEISTEEGVKFLSKKSIVPINWRNESGEYVLSIAESFLDAAQGFVLDDGKFISLGEFFAMALARRGANEVLWFSERKPNVGAPIEFKGKAADVQFIGGNTVTREIYLSYEGFDTPRTYYAASDRQGEIVFDRLWQEPSRFDAPEVEVKGTRATVDEDVKVPVREIAKAGRDRAGPAMVVSYGGYGLPLMPQYVGGLWEDWIAKGGSVVFAYPRGDGGFGQKWYEAAETFVDADITAGDLLGVARELKRENPGRCIFLQGGSYGGYMASMVGLMAPEQFVGLVTSNAVFDLDQFRDERSGGRHIRQYEELARKAGKPLLSPIDMIPQGEDRQDLPAFLLRTTANDMRVDPSQSERMRDALVRAGADARLVSFPYGGHELALTAEDRKRYIQVGLDFVNEIAEREGCW